MPSNSCSVCKHFYPSDGKVIPHCMKYDEVTMANGFPSRTICDDFSDGKEICDIDHATFTLKQKVERGGNLRICMSCYDRIQKRLPLTKAGL